MNIKSYCHQQVAKALREGRLVKSDSCSECGNPGHLIAHHDEYSIAKALVVRWMHYSCHSLGHRYKFKITIKETQVTSSYKTTRPNGELVCSLRLKQELSRTILSKLAGVPQYAIRKIEVGLRINIDTLRAVAEVLGCTMDDLVTD